MAFGQILGGIIGAIAGGEPDKTKQVTRRFTAEAGEQEQLASGIVSDQLKQLQALISGGPGTTESQAGLQSQQELAALLEKFAAGGFVPNQEQIQRGQQFASDVFAPQQVALNQALAEQQVQADRRAGQLGRPVSDPILQAKLAQERARGTLQLQARQGAFAAQFSQNIPLQQLGFQQAATQVRSGLATQALQNRQVLLGLGSGIQQQGQAFRLGTQDITQTGTSGGGLKGAITGGLAGAGAGASLFSSFGGFGGGGGGASVGSTGQAAGFGSTALASPF